MRGLVPIAKAEAPRVRRWDALVLGGALPGLIAAARLGQRGLRVLVIEEKCDDVAWEAAREPELLVDADSQGFLGECLRTLGIPLIDQRRFTHQDIAVQVCDAKSRIEIGRATHTVDEIADWGFAPREVARSLVDALHDAAELERTLLLEATLDRGARRAARARAEADPTTPPRGWPTELASAPPRLRALFDAPLRALSNLGAGSPSDEARARLIGGLLRGGVAVSGGPQGVYALLRRRVESLYGEFRAIPHPFRLVSVANQPGVATSSSKEIWTGRALLLNAPTAAIAGALEPPVPDLLRAPPIRWRRHSVRFRGARELLPPALSDFALWLDDLESGAENAVALRVHRGRRREDGFEVRVSAVVPVGDDTARAAAEERFERALGELLPFSTGRLERAPLPAPSWDTDSLLPDATADAWPQEPDLRLSSKPAIYRLERSGVGGLGVEGDLWLGWRAGDAIAADLA